MQSLLEIEHLSITFQTEDGPITAVDDISLTSKAGETVCIVGESGSGKSVTSLSILRLLEQESGAVVSGQIFFNGEDLMRKSRIAMRQIRGNQIAMIFQEPMTAFNPLMTIGDQIAEALLLHSKKTRSQVRTRVVELLQAVGMAEPEIRMRQYPHEFSGGMRQRAMIAMALACNPKLLIADEPTTALDVTIQAQILDLLRQLKSEYAMSLLLITHDIGVAAEMADRVIVLYAGKVMEEGTVEQVLDHPHHPYTLGLLASIPGLEGERRERLHTIGGAIPNMARLPKGCRFSPRCSFATDQCRVEAPSLRLIANRSVACWHAEKAVQAATSDVEPGAGDRKETSFS